LELELSREEQPYKGGRIMRRKRLLVAAAALIVALALVIGPMPGLMHMPKAHAAEAQSVLISYGFNEDQPETLFWLVPIGLVTPIMFWMDMHRGAY
jgi:hypothetical protein